MERVQTTRVSNASPAAKGIKLNEKDRALLAALEAAPELTAERLAERVETLLRNVRRRLRSLREAGVIEVVTRVTPAYTRYPIRYMISIDLHLPELQSKRFGYSDQQSLCRFLGAELARRPEFAHFTSQVRVDGASIVLGGRSDLVAFVAAASPTAICDFVTRVLRVLPGIQTTNTASLF